MHRFAILLAIFVFASIHASPVSVTAVPKRYRVNGIIELPYAEIREPFESWIDVDAGFSRIDYYDGAAKTLQRKAGSGENFGANYKIVPMSDEQVLNKISCFQANGSKDDPVDVQHTIPDISSFQNSRTGEWRGIKCEIYESIDVVGEKTSTYTYYVSLATKQPLYYEMFGYDSLIGSHFDKYMIYYFGYSEEPFSASIFNVTDGMTCTGFPGPGLKHTTPRVLFNPMSEYINRHGEEHFVNSFDEFKAEHGHQYEHEIEHRQRLNIFRNNVRYVNTQNRAGLTYKMKINKFADRTDDELRVLRGRRQSQGYNGGLPFPQHELKANLKDIPDTIDWRIMGAVTPVKDQGICGSCWSFGTTGAIEGAYFVKHGSIVVLSEQNLIDCSWGFGNNGCDGGEDFRSYQYIMKHGGIALEYSYGPYLQEDGFCHQTNATIGAKLLGYVNVTEGDENALKYAIATKGPVSVAIDAAHKGFLFYSTGVFYDPECGNKPDDLDHAVLAVGYGSLNGSDYWLVKNSWSTYWGNDGYVLMSQKDNNCGVATAATYVLVE